MNDLECPYCGKQCSPNDEYRDQDTTYEHECEHCGKNFVYTITYHPFYTSSEAPCLNGEEHSFKPIIGVPEWYFKNKFRCEYCGEEKEIK